MYQMIPLLNVIGLEAVRIYPRVIYLVSVCITALTIFFIYRCGKKMRVSNFSLIVSGVLFVVVHHVMFLFLEGVWFIHGFIILTSGIFFMFLYSIYERFIFQKKGQSFIENEGTARRAEGTSSYALENIIGYFNLLVFFLLTSDVLYIDLNTNQKFMWLLLLFIVSSFFLSYSSFAILNIHFKKITVLYLGVLLLAVVEIFWVISFLPISVYSKGVLVTLAYYVVLGLSRHYLIFGEAELTTRVVRRYLIITSVGVVLVFLTSRW